MAKIDNDEVSNNSGNPTFDEIVRPVSPGGAFSAAVLLPLRQFLSAVLMLCCVRFRPRPKTSAKARSPHC